MRFKKGSGGFNLLKILLILFLIANPIIVVTAGNVGAKDFFGMVSKNYLTAGIHIVIPFTKVIKLPIRTQEILEMAEVPSKENFTMNLDVLLLFHLKEEFAPEIYKK